MAAPSAKRARPTWSAADDDGFAAGAELFTREWAAAQVGRPLGKRLKIDDQLLGAATAAGDGAGAAAASSSARGGASSSHLQEAQANAVAAYREMNSLINLLRFLRPAGAMAAPPSSSGSSSSSSSAAAAAGAGGQVSLFDCTSVSGRPTPEEWFERQAVRARGHRSLQLRAASTTLALSAARLRGGLRVSQHPGGEMLALVTRGWRVMDTHATCAAIAAAVCPPAAAAAASTNEASPAAAAPASSQLLEWAAHAVAALVVAGGLADVMPVEAVLLEAATRVQARTPLASGGAAGAAGAGSGSGASGGALKVLPPASIGRASATPALAALAASGRWPPPVPPPAALGASGDATGTSTAAAPVAASSGAASGSAAVPLSAPWMLAHAHAIAREALATTLAQVLPPGEPHVLCIPPWCNRRAAAWIAARGYGLRLAAPRLPAVVDSPALTAAGAAVLATAAPVGGGDRLSGTGLSHWQRELVRLRTPVLPLPLAGSTAATLDGGGGMTVLAPIGHQPFRLTIICSGGSSAGGSSGGALARTTAAVPLAAAVAALDRGQASSTTTTTSPGATAAATAIAQAIAGAVCEPVPDAAADDAEGGGGGGSPLSTSSSSVSSSDSTPSQCLLVFAAFLADIAFRHASAAVMATAAASGGGASAVADDAIAALAVGATEVDAGRDLGRALLHALVTQASIAGAAAPVASAAAAAGAPVTTTTTLQSSAPGSPSPAITARCGDAEVTVRLDVAT